MKGISSFITYALTILIGFSMVTFFSFLIFTYYDQVLRMNTKASLKQIAIQTTSGIISLYDTSKKVNIIPENSSSIIISEMDLNYPNKVSDKNFEVQLISSPGIWNWINNITIEGEDVNIKEEISSGNKIIVKTNQRPYVSYEYNLPNIPVILQGSFKSGENDILKLVRYNYNGTVEDVVILGESDIIVGIKSVS